MGRTNKSGKVKLRAGLASGDEGVSSIFQDDPMYLEPCI